MIDETTSQNNGRSAADMRRRDELVAAVQAQMDADPTLSKADCARRIDIGHGTFSDWFKGSYKGRFDTVNQKVANWLDNLAGMAAITASVPTAPDYLPLAFSEDVMRMISVAQVMSAMVMVTAEAGIGKTAAAQQYVTTRANSWLVTFSPSSKSLNNMLSEIAATIGCEERHAGRLVRAIGKRLQRLGDGTVLICDEAQNLSDEAINQLRHFVDNYGCGVALLGNSETYSRFSRWGQGDKFGQLRSRIFKRIKADRATPDDIALYIDAWGITDPKQVEFLTGVGMKPGALRQVGMTIKLASMVAQGLGRDMTLADIKAAWSNRDVEVL